jgi:hypothetical protein
MNVPPDDPLNDADVLAGRIKQALRHATLRGEAIDVVVICLPRGQPVDRVNVIISDGVTIELARAACVIAIAQIDHTV